MFKAPQRWCLKLLNCPKRDMNFPNSNFFWSQKAIGSWDPIIYQLTLLKFHIDTETLPHILESSHLFQITIFGYIHSSNFLVSHVCCQTTSIQPRPFHHGFEVIVSRYRRRDHTRSRQEKQDLTAVPMLIHKLCLIGFCGCFFWTIFEMVFLSWNDDIIPALPETNSSPLKIAHPKRKLVLVSGRVVSTTYINQFHNPTSHSKKKIPPVVSSCCPADHPPPFRKQKSQQKVFPRKLKWQWNIIIFNYIIGDTSSNGWFSIVMSVFFRVQIQEKHVKHSLQHAQHQSNQISHV